MNKSVLPFYLFTFLLFSCGLRQQTASSDPVAATPVGPTFVADSAYAYCEQQCAFGPRTMNSPATTSVASG